MTIKNENIILAVKSWGSSQKHSEATAVAGDRCTGRGRKYRMKSLNHSASYVLAKTFLIFLGLVLFSFAGVVGGMVPSCGRCQPTTMGSKLLWVCQGQPDLSKPLKC